MGSNFGSFPGFASIDVSLALLGSPGSYPHKFVHLVPQRSGQTTTYVEDGELWGRLDAERIVIRNFPDVTASHRLTMKATGVTYRLTRVDKGQDEMICTIEGIV